MRRKRNPIQPFSYPNATLHIWPMRFGQIRRLLFADSGLRLTIESRRKPRQTWLCGDSAPAPVTPSPEPSSMRVTLVGLPARSFSGGLAFVAQIAQRLQVGWIPHVSALLDGLDMVYEYSGHNPSLGGTVAAQRFGPKHARPMPLPAGGMVEGVGCIVPRLTLRVVRSLLLVPVLIAQSGRVYQHTAARSSTWRLRSPRHRWSGLEGLNLALWLGGQRIAQQCLDRNSESARQ